MMADLLRRGRYADEVMGILEKERATEFAKTLTSPPSLQRAHA